MTKKSETGRIGEDIAVGYLKNKGYRIIERNFRRPWGEIDIVAMTSDGTLVFVEVKAMTTAESEVLRPEDNITHAKLKRLKRTASLYAGEESELVHDAKGWRIDAIAIDLTENEKNVGIRNLRHFENL